MLKNFISKISNLNSYFEFQLLISHQLIGPWAREKKPILRDPRMDISPSYNTKLGQGETSQWRCMKHKMESAAFLFSRFSWNACHSFERKKAWYIGIYTGIIWIHSIPNMCFIHFAISFLKRPTCHSTSPLSVHDVHVCNVTYASVSSFLDAISYLVFSKFDIFILHF